jgi:hypothetical protein
VFDKGNTPCILTHAMEDWPAYKGGWSKVRNGSREKERKTDNEQQKDD